MSLRKKLIIAAAVVLVLSLSAYSTLAYLAAETTAHNVVTSGGVHIELLDKTRDEGQETAEVETLRDFTTAYPNGLAVLPGSEASKVVAVSADAESADCWDRVKLVQQVTTPEGVMPAEQYKDKITLNLDGNWLQKEGEDGWYYYNKVLTGGDKTTNLLDGVTFKGPDMGNEFKNSSYTIMVQAQAVQAAHNQSAADGVNSVLDVQGWPQA